MRRIMRLQTIEGVGIPFTLLLSVLFLPPRSAGAQIVTETESRRAADECVELTKTSVSKEPVVGEPNYFGPPVPENCLALSEEEGSYLRYRRGGITLLVSGIIIGIPSAVVLFWAATLAEKASLALLIPVAVGTAYGLAGAIAGNRMIKKADTGFQKLGRKGCRSRMCLRQVSLVTGGEQLLRPSGLQATFLF